MPELSPPMTREQMIDAAVRHAWDTGLEDGYPVRWRYKNAPRQFGFVMRHSIREIFRRIALGLIDEQTHA